MTRREAMKAAAWAGTAAALGTWRGGAQPAGGGVPAGAARTIAAYLERHRKDGGGYGWEDQEPAHLTPTFAAVGAYRALGLEPPAKAAVADYVRKNHPRELKKLEQERRAFEFQQVQALVWLGAETTEFRATIGAWREPLPYLKQYEQNGYPVFASELGAVLARPLLGLPTEGMEAWEAYLDARRRDNGSFNNTPAADGGDGQVTNTWWGVQALQVLGRAGEKRAETIAWLQSCQLANGGFTYAPRPEFGGVDDVAYTRSAVRTLALLGGAPRDRAGVVAYLKALANADGGFSDRPGWRSNPLATFYALDVLAALGALGELGTLAPRPARVPATIPAELKAWTIQIQAHGQGSPHDTVELARALKIDLWGAKNAKPEWLARVRELAAARRVATTFFTANEEYGTWVRVPGMGTYSHTADLVAPADADIGPALGRRGNTDAVTWPEFRARRLAPLERAGGRLVWQFGENEELVRMLLDDSVECGGFAALSTYHFGNPDFTNTEPFLQRWRGKIPYIALQDAHGPEPWFFSDQTSGFRTVFLATEPTWAAWLDALRHDRVVAVRRDVWTKGRTWMHGGSREVMDAVRARELQWRWWDNPAIQRPMLSLAVLTPADALERGAPERGVALRVRCAWTNSPQGLAKEPISEFVRLTVDGRETRPVLLERKNRFGAYEEHAYVLPLPQAAPGRHTATATVRVRETKREATQTVEFVV